MSERTEAMSKALSPRPLAGTPSGKQPAIVWALECLVERKFLAEGRLVRARLLPGAASRCQVQFLESEPGRIQEFALADLLAAAEIRAASEPQPDRTGAAGQARSTAAERVGARLEALCRRECGDIPVRALIHRDTGMLVVDRGIAAGKLIGPGGSTVDRIRRLAGLRSLRVVRSPAARARRGGGRHVGGRHAQGALVPDASRLRSALRSFGAAPGRLLPPAQQGGPWTAVLDRNDLPRMLAGGGASLFLLARLAGVSVRFDLAEPGAPR